MEERLSIRIATAEREVVEARRKVERQSKIVATYERRHMNTSDALAWLAQLEQQLAVFEAHLESIKALRIDRDDPGTAQ